MKFSKIFLAFRRTQNLTKNSHELKNYRANKLTDGRITEFQKRSTG